MLHKGQCYLVDAALFTLGARMPSVALCVAVNKLVHLEYPSENTMRLFCSFCVLVNKSVSLNDFSTMSDGILY
jgi:hypothetical protein